MYANFHFCGKKFLIIFLVDDQDDSKFVSSIQTHNCETLCNLFKYKVCPEVSFVFCRLFFKGTSNEKKYSVMVVSFSTKLYPFFILLFFNIKRNLNNNLDVKILKPNRYSLFVFLSIT
jgi:hypothetical protein